MCDYIMMDIWDGIEDFLVDSFYTQESQEKAKEEYNAICERIRREDFVDKILEKVTETYNEYLTDNDYLNNLCAKIARAERLFFLSCGSFAAQTTRVFYLPPIIAKTRSKITFQSLSPISHKIAGTLLALPVPKNFSFVKWQFSQR